MSNLKVDHIVLFVPDLQKALLFFEEHLGVLPLIGGKHPGQEHTICPTRIARQ